VIACPLLSVLPPLEDIHTLPLDAAGAFWLWDCWDHGLEGIEGAGEEAEAWLSHELDEGWDQGLEGIEGAGEEAEAWLSHELDEGWDQGLEDIEGVGAGAEGWDHGFEGIVGLGAAAEGWLSHELEGMAGIHDIPLFPPLFWSIGPFHAEMNNMLL